MSLELLFLEVSVLLGKIVSVHLSNNVTVGSKGWQGRGQSIAAPNCPCMYRTDLLAKAPLLSVTALMESQDKDGTLARCCVCVPGTRNRYSWFHRLFYSRGSSQLKCLSLLFNDTSRQTVTHGGAENKRETNKLAVEPSRCCLRFQMKPAWCGIFL